MPAGLSRGTFPRDFPEDTRHDAGYQLDKVQRGEQPDEFKPMPAVGKGVEEIRVTDESGAYTARYLVEKMKLKKIGILQEIVTMARTLRTEAKLDPKLQLDATVYSRNSALEVAQRHATAIQKLANVKLEFRAEAAPRASAKRSFR